jgi:hypothetical protein
MPAPFPFIDPQVEDPLAGWHAFGGRHFDLIAVEEGRAADESMAPHQSLKYRRINSRRVRAAE